MERRDRRWGDPATRAAVCAALLFVAVVSGCKKERNIEESGLGLPDTTSTGTEAPKMEQPCRLDEEVSAPAEGTPEWVVGEMLAAAADPGDEEAAFTRFHGQYESSKDAKWVRSQYWKAARAQIQKLLPPDYEAGGPLTYTICRREESGSRLKLFVKSWDIDKAHVPVTLKKDGEAWKVATFSP